MHKYTDTPLCLQRPLLPPPTRASSTYPLPRKNSKLHANQLDKQIKTYSLAVYAAPMPRCTFLSSKKWMFPIQETPTLHCAYFHVFTKMHFHEYSIVYYINTLSVLLKKHTILGRHTFGSPQPGQCHFQGIGHAQQGNVIKGAAHKLHTHGQAGSDSQPGRQAHTR